MLNVEVAANKAWLNVARDNAGGIAPDQTINRSWIARELR